MVLDEVREEAGITEQTIRNDLVADGGDDVWRKEDMASMVKQLLSDIYSISIKSVLAMENAQGSPVRRISSDRKPLSAVQPSSTQQ